MLMPGYAVKRRHKRQSAWPVLTALDQAVSMQ